MCLFLKPKQELGKKISYSIEILLGSCFMMFIIELLRNGSGTARNRYLPSYFFAISS